MEISLRAAELSDASALAALSSEVWTGTYLRWGINSFFADYVLDTFTREAFQAILADPAEQITVSQNTMGIDGFVRVTSGAAAPVSGCTDTELTTLYVQPRHHGKGIGHALLQAGIALAQARDAKGLWLATNAENAPAISFYLAQGFTHVGETHFRVQDQAYLNNVYALTWD